MLCAHLAVVGSLLHSAPASRLSPTARLPPRCQTLLACAGQGGGGGGALEDHGREVAALHTRFATSAGAPGAPSKSRAAHNSRQAACFDEAAGFFSSADATPAEVVPALRAIAAAAAVGPSSSVLDVGVGTGALLPYYLERGVREAAITGVDLSARMLDHARARYPAATFVHADVVDVDGSFDAVVFNSVFGNLHDQAAALAHAAALVPGGGTVLISHPLGAAFVDDLREKDPSVVPHSLPSRQALLRLLLSTNSPLRLDAHADSSPASDSAAAVPYLAVLRKSAVLPLADGFAALAGPVCAGYGRGSRKLGVPTANLPCSLFQSQLAELRTGVYVGWAAARGGVHKCVVNVGYSPTFEGKENKEVVVEAHLMHTFSAEGATGASDGAADGAAEGAAEGADAEVDDGFVEFYGEELRLLLLGFVRPEKKFDSFDELLSTIRSDIATAAAELDTSPYAEIGDAAWLRQSLGEGSGAVFRRFEPTDSAVCPAW